VKFLFSSVGILILALVLGLGTTGGLIYSQRATFKVVEKLELPPRLWSFKTEEIDSLVNELKAERKKLDKREGDLEQTSAHIEAERQELDKVKASIKAMRDEISKEIPEVQEVEIKNLKTLSQTYSNITPTAAVVIFQEMDERNVVKILSLMKADKVAGILQEMSRTPDKDGTLAKLAARVSDKLRVLKTEKSQPTTP